MKMEDTRKSRVISARIKGDDLELFNELNLTPKEIFDFGLQKIFEENTYPERVSLMSKIQSTMKDIKRCELELTSKKSMLKSLEEELEVLENS